MRASRLRFGTLNGFLGEVLCISDSFETLKLVFFDTILEFDIVATGLELLQRQRRETMTLNYHLAGKTTKQKERYILKLLALLVFCIFLCHLQNSYSE